ALFFAGAVVAARIALDADIRRHPAQDRVAAVSNLAAGQQRLERLARLVEVSQSLREFQHFEAVLDQFTGELPSVPRVDGQLGNSHALAKLVDSLANRREVGRVARSRLNQAVANPTLERRSRKIEVAIRR